MRPSVFVLAGFYVSVCAVNARAADPAAWLPAEINAVARINVADIYKTPLAKKEGWLKKATESFVQQESFIPPGTNQIMIGAELDLADNMMARRKYAVLVPEDQLTLEKLSLWLPDGIETIAGKKMAQFGNDGYVVDAGDGCWLTTSSSSRQIISRWLKNGPMPGGPQLSSYLRSALKSKDNTGQLMIAIDLQDNFSEQKMSEKLKETSWFSAPASIESVAKVLESVKGITISIAADAERVGTATIDFARDTAPLKPILDKLIAEVALRVGISTDDIFDWKWTVKGSQVIGTGPVSPGGGRRMLSFLDPPSITHAISASASTDASASAEDRMARVSLKYCKSVEVLIGDLRKTLRNEHDNHAVYLDRYARKIDDLPKLNVDSQLLDFAGAVGSSFRYQSQSTRMNFISAGTSKQGIQGGNYGGGNYGYVGPYGNYNNTYGLGAVRAVGQAAATTEAVANLAAQSGVIDAQANQANQAVRFSEWKQIEEGLNNVRRTMTEKYKIEF